MVKIFLSLLCFLLLFCFDTRDLKATSFFTEDFSQRNESNWEYFCNYSGREYCLMDSNNITYNDGSITLSTDSSNFPVVLSKSNIIPVTGDFALKVKFRYPRTTNRGVGLGIGHTGPAPYYKLFSQFGIWKDTSSGQGFKFYYNDFSENQSQGYCFNFTNSTSDTFGRVTIANISLSESVWHILEIYRFGDTYEVYIDKDRNIDPIFTADIRNNCVPNIIWFGNFISDGGGAWTTFSLDSIEVLSDYLPGGNTPTPTLIPTPTPTLTPTPMEIPKKMKVFILPGLGASWNSEAIVYNKQVGIGDWSMTPFVKNYYGLIRLLENNGLIKDQDFYVWNYDWRKSIGDIENDFNSFIGSKSLSGNDEIYLVGHSLGGVVARLWAQDNKNDNRIKQVINLGSPNLGSLDSYSVWNGGEVLEYDGVSSVAFQILLGLQNKSFLVKNIDKIRDYAPVAKDLLPIFDYTIRNNKSVSWNKLSFVNNYLSTKNNNISDVSDRLVSFIGTGNQTPKTIKLGARSIYDKVMNLWPDGEILSLVKSDGDGTVLTNSSGFGTLNKREVVSTHEEITNKSLLGIADVLSLGNRNVDFEYTDNFENSLVVFIGSPAKAELNCDGDTYYEDNGFIVAKDKSYSDCDLKLSPTNNGLVHVVLGNTGNNSWSYFEKEVKNEVVETVKIDFKDASIANDKDNEDFLRNQIKFDLETLKLSKVIKFLNKNDFAKVAVAVFGYREKNNEREITQRILDNLFKLSLITGLDKKKDNYKLLSSYVDLIELSISVKSKRKPISDESGVSLVRLGELEGTVKSLVKQKDYPNYSLVWVLANGYGFESLLR